MYSKSGPHQSCNHVIGKEVLERRYLPRQSSYQGLVLAGVSTHILGDAGITVLAYKKASAKQILHSQSISTLLEGNLMKRVRSHAN